MGFFSAKFHLPNGILLCFFLRILKSLPPIPRQHSAAIGCRKNYQQIGVTVHLHCVESFEGLLQRCRRGSGCSELWKNTLLKKLLNMVRIFEVIYLYVFLFFLFHLFLLEHDTNPWPTLGHQKLFNFVLSFQGKKCKSLFKSK